jgi:hypothetical protein
LRRGFGIIFLFNRTLESYPAFVVAIYLESKLYGHGAENQEVYALRKSRMKKSRITIRNLAASAILLIGSLATAQTAGPVIGTVVNVNPGAHTFTMHWEASDTHHHFTARSSTVSREKTFKTTDSTDYVVGGKKGTSASLTKGAKIRILAAHTVGSDRVVDKVEIVSGS